MASSKTGSSRKTPRKIDTKNVGAAAKNDSHLVREVVVILIMLFAVLLIISVFTASGAGIVGKLLGVFVKGMFGVGAYFLPFMIAVICILHLIKKFELKAKNLILIAVLFICAISLMHVITYQSSFITSFNRNEPPSFFNVLGKRYAEAIVDKDAVTSKTLTGGFVGALFGEILRIPLKEVFSSILLFTLALVSVILLTGRSFFKLVSHLIDVSSAKYSEIHENNEKKKLVQSKKNRLRTFEAEENDVDGRIISVTNKNNNEIKSHTELLIDKDEKGKKEQKIIFASEELNGHDISKTVTTAQAQSATEIVIQGDIEAEGDIETENDIEPPPDELMPELRINGFIEGADAPPSEPKKSEIFIKTSFDEDTEDELIEDYLYNHVAGSEVKINEKFEVETNCEADPDDELDDEDDLAKPKTVSYEDYQFPGIDLLNVNNNSISNSTRAQILENSKKLEDTLKSFGVEAKVVEVTKGPAITRYELSPGIGVQVNSISKRADDLALSLAAISIRIEAPIPGKSVVGIEIPNKEVMPVYIREVIEDEQFQNFPSKLSIALGKDIAGNVVVSDIARMPHMLIAGATGSGKSVCINTIITSILYKSRPDEVKLLLIDPKVVELNIYNGIPHLLIPVVTDPKKAAGALNWAVREMVNRYNMFAEATVRDIKGYNAYKKEIGETDFLPQIVIIIDELADLMMVAKGEVEDAICRLAQMARAAGLHLIVATQRPSVDVITGIIKANIPSRLAFAVSSGTDSRTILNMNGAEKLLGKGDMLFYPAGLGMPQRIQGALISDKEVEHVVGYLKSTNEVMVDQSMIETITSGSRQEELSDDLDEHFRDAVEFVIEKKKASASMIQREFRIGYNRAARIIEDMEVRGIISHEDGAKPRKVLLSSSEWHNINS